MKQYVELLRKREPSPKNRETYKQRKFRFPVAQHLNQAGRPLSSPHGGRNYTITIGHKKCQRQLVGEHRRLIQMLSVANIKVVFRMTKEK